MICINMVYAYCIVCVACVPVERLVAARPPKKLKGLILHLKDPILPKWFLEAALQLKIKVYRGKKLWIAFLFVCTYKILSNYPFHFFGS